MGEAALLAHGIYHLLEVAGVAVGERAPEVAELALASVKPLEALLACKQTLEFLELELADVDRKQAE